MKPLAALRRLDGGGGSTAIGQGLSIGPHDAVLFDGGLASAPVGLAEIGRVGKEGRIP